MRRGKAWRSGRRWLTTLGAALIGVLWLMPATALSASNRDRSAPLAPIPLSVQLDADAVALGEQLFHDARLSGRNDRACATCHQLSAGGDDGKPRARLANGDLHPYNTPTLFNAALNFRYLWTGTIRKLETLIERVLLHPNIMQNTWPALLAELQADTAYVNAFNALSPNGVTRTQVLAVLTSYVKSLRTPNARFDRFLRGQRDALSAAEQRGYALFKSYGCAACHQGVNVGGNLFQKFGVFIQDEHPAPDAGHGRFDVTGMARDRDVFRVPSLRNAALTAPYFHDGRASTLQDAVGTMAQRQLGRALAPDDIDLIVRFLHTLTGEYRGRSLAGSRETAP